jgi:hypothetical protein
VGDAACNDVGGVLHHQTRRYTCAYVLHHVLLLDWVFAFINPSSYAFDWIQANIIYYGGGKVPHSSVNSKSSLTRLYPRPRRHVCTKMDSYFNDELMDFGHSNISQMFLPRRRSSRAPDTQYIVYVPVYYSRAIIDAIDGEMPLAIQT